MRGGDADDTLGYSASHSRQNSQGPGQTRRRVGLRRQFVIYWHEVDGVSIAPEELARHADLPVELYDGGFSVGGVY